MTTQTHPVLIRPTKDLYVRIAFIADIEQRDPTNQALLAVKQHVDDFFKVNPDAESAYRKFEKAFKKGSNKF